MSLPRTSHLPHPNHLTSTIPLALTGTKPRHFMATFRSSHCDARFPMLVPPACQITKICMYCVLNTFSRTPVCSEEKKLRIQKPISSSCLIAFSLIPIVNLSCSGTHAEQKSCAGTQLLRRRSGLTTPSLRILWTHSRSRKCG
jgi:hypothetical protein